MSSHKVPYIQKPNFVFKGSLNEGPHLMFMEAVRLTSLGITQMTDGELTISATLLQLRLYVVIANFISCWLHDTLLTWSPN